ncbi:MAG: hypothetical protein GF311_23860 [Candidatus Lokiarchaeota archaeon]|nr:hypothetical protein [Candidatus Lokiarchaeota archaeon]
MQCELCKKIFSRTRKKKVYYRKIVFCSKKCFEEWKKILQQPKEHKYVIWFLKVSSINIEFQQNEITTKGIDPEYGNITNNSHFSTKLGLIIKRRFEE